VNLDNIEIYFFLIELVLCLELAPSPLHYSILPLGKWIVKPSWIIDSANYDMWLTEDQFEAADLVPGASLCRRSFAIECTETTFTFVFRVDL